MGIKKTYPHSATVVFPDPVWNFDPKIYEKLARDTLGENQFEFRYRKTGPYYSFQNNGVITGSKSKNHQILRIRFYFKTEEDRNLFSLMSAGVEKGVQIVYNK